MVKNKDEKEAKEKLKLFVKNSLNNLIFSDLVVEGLKPSEIKEELEYRNKKPQLLTEKVFTKFMLSSMDEMGIKISLKDLRQIIKDLKKGNKFKIFQKNFLVSKEFIEYSKFIGKDLEFNYVKDNDEEIKGVLENKLSKGTEFNLVCPYCDSQSKYKVFKTDEEYNCPNCKKTFRSVIGIARGARGLGGYVAHQVVIRLQKIEGGEDTITYYSSYQGVEIRANDVIAATYKRGLLGGWGNKPKLIQNFSIGQYFNHL